MIQWFAFTREKPRIEAVSAEVVASYEQKRTKEVSMHRSFDAKNRSEVTFRQKMLIGERILNLLDQILSICLFLMSDTWVTRGMSWKFEIWKQTLLFRVFLFKIPTGHSTTVLVSARSSLKLLRRSWRWSRIPLDFFVANLEVIWWLGGS